MTAKPNFKKRYVLGTGYPWLMGFGEQRTIVALAQEPIGFSPIYLTWPEEFSSNELPQYRLIFERVEKDKKK